MPLTLHSLVFEDHTEIPKYYTGDGEDASPSLQWSGAPPETREYAIICEDPDAPQSTPFIHWLIYHLPAASGSLPERLAAQETLDIPRRADQGMNSFGKIGYGGPLPPVGHGVHRYFFRLYALNAHLDLEPGATHEQLLGALEGKILESAQLVGTYKREARKKTG